MASSEDMNFDEDSKPRFSVFERSLSQAPVSLEVETKPDLEDLTLSNTLEAAKEDDAPQAVFGLNAVTKEHVMVVDNVLAFNEEGSMTMFSQLYQATGDIIGSPGGPNEQPRACWALSIGDIQQLYKAQCDVVDATKDMLSVLKDQNWMLPIVRTVCSDLRIIASRADIHRRVEDAQEKAAPFILNCFRICAADTRASEEDTKRWGMLGLVNELIRIYFRINCLNLCRPLIRAIDQSALKDRFPLSHRITYMYFVGRKAMFDSNYKQADEYLSYAFIHCHKSCTKNKRLILLHLIPVKLILGVIPKQDLLQKYNLPQFSEVVTSVRTGNLRLFNQTLNQHQAFFIQSGIYLILEKAKIIVLRNLFKKIYILTGTHQVDIQLFQHALKAMGEEDVDTAETQCILGNLIFDGHIKGYISHQHNKLVVSKQNPFPPLGGVQVAATG
ncbi:unnamed protein product [Cyprideis torosa]|uniref:PCI domain-containing protein 2 homolog n=1 Tax=Cyprideis torosa TaxID=163714 RepID=A0A7R8WDI1_9CRUS|nr:unnamed protein product [Cyprideis torosa]CAG0894758.1 unnamed protein product [Cyprideis torosa]